MHICLILIIFDSSILKTKKLESLEKIKQKYNDILKRSFKTKLELFLFSKCHNEGGIDNISPEEFNWFEITDELVKELELAWTLREDQRLKEGGLAMKEIDDKIIAWKKDNSSFKDELLKQYQMKFKNELFPFPEFETIYDLDPEKRICHYCGISVSLRLPASCSLIFSRLALPVKTGIYEKSGKETTTRENVLVY